MSKRKKYTKELLEPIVRGSLSLAEVMRKLNLSCNGGNYRSIKQKCRFFGISTEHFTGAAWAKGQTKETNESVARVARLLRIPDEKVFCENSTYADSSGIRSRLFEKGWDYECKICGLTEWLDNPITLHIDHINGVHNDHRLTNLQFLCPNCHQQTDTWGNKGGNQYCRPATKTVIKSNCKDCNTAVLQSSTRCRSCNNKRTGGERQVLTKIQWPSNDTLKRMVESTNVHQVSIKLGVSYNAVKKRLKKIKAL